MKTKGEDKIPQVLLFVKSRSRKKICFSFIGMNIKLSRKNMFSKLKEIKDHVGNYNIK